VTLLKLEDYKIRHCELSSLRVIVIASYRHCELSSLRVIVIASYRHCELSSLRAQRSKPGADVALDAVPGLLRCARNDGIWARSRKTH
jgi:hypothetical protein